MKKTGKSLRKHKIHNNRFLIDSIGKFLHREKCSCIFHFDNSGECRRRFILDDYYTVAGTYGDDVYICSYCYLGDKKEIDEWSKGRKDFVNHVIVNDPELWEISNRHRSTMEGERFS